MNEQQESYSFGRYLQSIRLEKGISLEDVSRETRIRVGTLLLIEKEDHENLPAEIFVKGFLRSFARAIGADEEVALNRYISVREEAVESARVEADLGRSEGPFWRRFLLALLIFGALIYLTIQLIPSGKMVPQHKGKPDHEADTAAPSINTEPTQAEAPQKVAAPHTPAPTDNREDPTVRSVSEKAGGDEPAAAGKKKTEAAPAASGVLEIPSTGPTSPSSAVPIPTPQKENYILKILAVERTWMKVIIDNQKSREYTLSPGDRLALEADSEFNLLIGNAAGLKMELNGKTLNTGGKSGQVINVKIP